MALSSGSEATAAHGGRHGCNGGGCYGSVSCYGGGCHGGGHAGHGCHGGRERHHGRHNSCHGGGCYGGGCYGVSSCDCGGVVYGGGCYGGGYAVGGGCWGGGAVIGAPAMAAPAKQMVPPPAAKTEEKKEEVRVPTSATIVVTLPAEAKLIIDDYVTTSTSGTRFFATPALNPGMEYHYTLKAEMVRGGKKVAATKEVTVRAGMLTREVLELPSESVVLK
jgi:uncharacterized protein (TIGR03000 family)